MKTKMIRAAAAMGLCVCMLAGLCSPEYANVQAEEGNSKEPVQGLHIYEEEKTEEERTRAEGIVPIEISAFSGDEPQVVNFNTGTAQKVTEYWEAKTNAAGYTNGAYGADAAYLGTKDGKVCFMLSGVVGYVDETEVQLVPLSSAKTVSCYMASDGWLVHYISGNLNSTSYWGSVRIGKTPSYLQEGKIYYSYDGHYFYTDYAQMLEDYVKETRSSSVNPWEPYYNYFQYLPLRSKTQYTAAELDTVIERFITATGADYNLSKMNKIGESLITYQNRYGVNALLIAGMAALETGWGMSQIAQEKNNLFGLNAVDTSPGESANYYPDVDTCIREMMQLHMSWGYLDPQDYRYCGGFLGNKASGCNVKYASGPYWGEIAASLAWQLDEAMRKVDQNAYKLLVKDPMATLHHNIPIYAESNENSAVLFRSTQSCCTTYILKDSAMKNGFYQIQSDGLVNESRDGLAYSDVTEPDLTTAQYDFSHMYAYIRAIDLFCDVQEDQWYYEPVKNICATGIMTGLNSNRFGVMETVKRAQFATIIYRIAGSPEVTYRAAFPDVPDGTFFSKAAVWASDNRIITGYTNNGYFGINDDINREQMAVILYRYAEAIHADTSKKAELTTYPDASSVTPYAIEAMKWAVGSGIIRGDGGCLKPLNSTSREQCAAMITRFLEKL